MTPDEYCAARVRASGSSFYYSFKVLPAEKRQGMYTLYAFCRYADDVVDEASGADSARKAIDEWRDEFERCCAGSPRHPITISLREQMERFSIPRQPLDQVLDGVVMDIQRRRYESFEALREYCLRVASAPGVASIHVLGFHHPQTREYAENLGIALQLTNIIRDIGEDAARGRLYVPLDELHAHGCEESRILAGRPCEGFLPLMQVQAARARRYFLRAAQSLHPDDRRAMLCPQIMSAIYQDLLARIERSEFDVMRRRIRVPALRKVHLALRTCLTDGGR